MRKKDKLVDGIDPDADLHQAIVDGDAAAVARLVAGGRSVSARFSLEEDSALLANLRPQAREFLDYRYLYNITPLHLAAIAGRAEIAELLIASGASVKDKGGKIGPGREPPHYYPIHYAARANAVDVAQVLLAHGAAIDDQTECGRRPLHDACVTGSHEMIRFLVLAGAAWRVSTIVPEQTPFYLCGSEENRKVLMDAIRERREIRAQCAAQKEQAKWRKKHRALGRLRPEVPSL